MYGAIHWEYLLKIPTELFFGFGPDSILLLSNEFTQAASTNCSGRKEGTIDSGYFRIYLIMEFFFLSFFIIFNS